MAQTEVARINLSTVYRRLKDLVESGVIVRVDLPGHAARYEARPATTAQHRDDHHHHFHCNACDRVYPIHACPGPMKNLAPKGFRVEGHGDHVARALPRLRPGPGGCVKSVLMAGAGGRAAVVLFVAAGLWAAVFWAWQ